MSRLCFFSFCLIFLINIQPLFFIFQVSDEAKYVKTLKLDRNRQLHELRARVDENSSIELSSAKSFEDEIQSGLNAILASDDIRRASFQLIHEEEQQNVAVCV